MTEIKGHLLLVDDQPSNNLLLSTVFRRDYYITTAESGQAAIDLISEQSFDMVLLDIMMPDVNGLDVLEWIRQYFDMETLPVILVSALTDVKYVTQGLKAGANDYISKPFDVDVVRARVQTQLKIKRMAQERVDLINQLEQANETKRQLMRIAAHDLKNPIQNLGLLHSLIEDMTQGNAEVAEVLTVANDSTVKMMNIVQDFLDMEILRDGGMKVELEAVRLGEAVGDVIGQYSRTAEAKGIALNLISEDCLFAVGDPKRIRQVLSNLISNAIKYSPMNSQVTVAMDALDGTARIQVIDEGEGIPEFECERLFQPFAKISTIPTAGESSSGLGLWIVKQMMILQGGDVGMIPADTGGCNFWITLPLYRHGEAALCQSA